MDLAQRVADRLNGIPDPQDITALLGRTLVKIERNDHNSDGNEQLVFHTDKGQTYVMTHRQDCCECVSIEDITGDLDDLIGSMILDAREESNNKHDEEEYDSQTWTFYHLRTMKGSVTLRWLGSSNGYYSESVDFSEVTHAPD